MVDINNFFREHLVWMAIGLMFFLVAFAFSIFKIIHTITDMIENRKLFKEDSGTPENLNNLKESLSKRDSVYKIIRRKK